MSLIDILMWAFVGLSAVFWLANRHRLRKTAGMMFISKNPDGESSLFLELEQDPAAFENDKYVIFEIIPGDWKSRSKHSL